MITSLVASRQSISRTTAAERKKHARTHMHQCVLLDREAAVRSRMTSREIPGRHHSDWPPTSVHVMTSFPEAEKRTEVALAPGIWRRLVSTATSAVRRRFVLRDSGIDSIRRLPGLGHRGRVSFSSRAASSLFQRRQQQHTACLYRVPTARNTNAHEFWRLGSWSRAIDPETLLVTVHKTWSKE